MSLNKGGINLKITEKHLYLQMIFQLVHLFDIFPFLNKHSYHE